MSGLGKSIERAVSRDWGKRWGMTANGYGILGGAVMKLFWS